MKALLLSGILLPILGIAQVKKDSTSPQLADTSKLSRNKQLQEVTVKSTRPLVEQKADRLVVNVEGSALTSGNNALTVLARTPGVLVDADGNIQLNGRSGVTVMIDGRPTYLSARDLRNLLEGMPAENLRNIEVISNPPARYEAEGTAGILNLNLKKPVRSGTSASIYTGYQTNWKQSGWSAGASLNYKQDRWTAFASADFARRIGGREGTATRFFDGTNPLYFDQDLYGNFWVKTLPSVRAGADYVISSRQSIGFTASWIKRSSAEEFFTSTLLSGHPGEVLLRIGSRNYTNTENDSRSLNTHWVSKLDSAGTTLSADIDLVRIGNYRGGAFFNRYDSSTGAHYEDEQYTATPSSGYRIIAGRVDFSRPGPNGRKWESGIKVSSVRTDDDARYYQGAARLPDAFRSNHFQYDEKILAGYLSWEGSMGSNRTLKAGLRAEQTLSTGRKLTTGTTTNRNYLDLFPTVFLQQVFSDRYSLSLSYGRRVSRPNYSFLNPFRFYRDPYTWVEGNPYLLPQYSHQVDITQTFRKKFIATAWWKHTRNVMYESPVLDADSAFSKYTFANVGTELELGLTLVLPFRITRWWEVRNSFVLEWDRIDASYKTIQSNQNFFHDLQSMHTIQLPSEIRLELNAHYLGPSIMGIYLGDPWFQLDAGLKRSFAKKNVDVSINISDVFRSHRNVNLVKLSGSRSSFDQYLRFQALNLTLRYNLKRGQKIDTRRQQGLEELNRAGG